MNQPAPSQKAPTIREAFRVAWPLMLKIIMLHGIIVIDAWLIAPLGEEAIASLGLASALSTFLVGAQAAFNNATQIRLAQAFGSRNDVTMKSGLYCGIVISVALALLSAGFVVFFAPSIFAATAQTPAIAEGATVYLTILLIVIFAESVALSLTSFYNASGETRTSLISYAIALPVNVMASYALIHGHLGLPALGIAGAAIGSALGACLRLLVLSLMLARRNKWFIGVSGWHRGSFRVALTRHLVFSLPIAATFVSVTAGGSVCMLIYAGLEVSEFAAMTLMMPWIMVIGTLSTGWAHATGIIAAQLIGDKQPEPVLDLFIARVWRAVLTTAVGVSLIFAAVCLSVDILYPDLNETTTRTILSFLPVLMILPFPKGSNSVCGQTLRAGGETVFVMNVFVSSVWLVKVPVTALFVMVLDLSVVWVFATLLLEELVKLPFLHLRLFKGDWKHGSVLD